MVLLCSQSRVAHRLKGAKCWEDSAVWLLQRSPAHLEALRKTDAQIDALLESLDSPLQKEQ